MRKEIIYAIIAGSLLGLVIGFGIWRINATLSSNKNSRPPIGTKTQQNQNSPIAIAKPSDRDVISQSPVTITGIAQAQTTLVISSDEKDYLPAPDNKGSFEVDVDLRGGINPLTVVSIDNKGNVNKQILTLIYSTEFAKITPPTPTQTEAPTKESTSSVRKKVEEKVAAALNSPTSYLGTVTDIAESGVQLKGAAGEINQISTANNLTVIKDGKTPKEVKLTDIAIGDFIVAMGFTTGNHVLDSRRILITTPVQPASNEYLLATAGKAGKNQLTVNGVKDGKSLTLLPATSSVVYLKSSGQLKKIKFSDIAEFDTIVAVGSFSTSGQFKARTVFVTARP